MATPCLCIQKHSCFYGRLVRLPVSVCLLHCVFGLPQYISPCVNVLYVKICLVCDCFGCVFVCVIISSFSNRQTACWPCSVHSLPPPFPHLPPVGLASTQALCIDQPIRNKNQSPDGWIPLYDAVWHIISYCMPTCLPAIYVVSVISVPFITGIENYTLQDFSFCRFMTFNQQPLFITAV